MLFLSVYSVIVVLFIFGTKTALLPIILMPSSVMSSYGLETSCALMAQCKAHPSQCKMFVFFSCVYPMFVAFFWLLLFLIVCALLLHQFFCVNDCADKCVCDMVFCILYRGAVYVWDEFALLYFLGIQDAIEFATGTFVWCN